MVEDESIDAANDPRDMASGRGSFSLNANKIKTIVIIRIRGRKRIKKGRKKREYNSTSL